MPTVLEFKAKKQTVQDVRDLSAWRLAVQPPKDWKRTHVLQAGRRLSGLVNSDMLSAGVWRDLSGTVKPGALLYLDAPGVSFTEHGPLAAVTITIED